MNPLLLTALACMVLAGPVKAQNVTTTPIKDAYTFKTMMCDGHSNGFRIMRLNQPTIDCKRYNGQIYSNWPYQIVFLNGYQHWKVYDLTNGHRLIYNYVKHNYYTVEKI